MQNASDDERQIASIERLLQSIRPEPGERFHERMRRAPWQAALKANHGGFLMKQNDRAALLAVLGLILIAFLAFTPMGSVLAAEILRFFERAEENTQPLPAGSAIDPLPSPTLEPTYALTIQSAGEIETAEPTPTPIAEPGPAGMEGLSKGEAEVAAGFELCEPLNLPRDYRLTSIQYDPDREAVSLFYASPHAGSGEFFMITEGKKLEAFSVGPEASVETVPIGEYSAEFVRGSWFVADGASESIWEDQSETYTLRWQMGEITISILFMLNDSFNPAYLRREEMFSVARSLASCTEAGTAGQPPKDGATPQPDGERTGPAEGNLPGIYIDLASLEAVAGFDILEPELLPDRMPFSHARYIPESGAVMLFYGHFAPDKLHSTGPVLMVAEGLHRGSSLDPSDFNPPEALQQVEVNGLVGILFTGSLETGPAEQGQPAPTPTWNPDSGELLLSWETDEMVYSIRFTPSFRDGGRIRADDLLKIAESLH